MLLAAATRRAWRCAAMRRRCPVTASGRPRLLAGEVELATAANVAAPALSAGAAAAAAVGALVATSHRVVWITSDAPLAGEVRAGHGSRGPRMGVCTARQQQQHHSCLAAAVGAQAPPSKARCACCSSR